MAWAYKSDASLRLPYRLSADLAQRRIYPPVDPLTSRSRMLETGSVDPAHVELAARIREALRGLLRPGETPPPTDERVIERARKLLYFFAQPFYVAEPYTHRPGVTVSLAEALRVCRGILDGVHDDVPTAAFYFTGGLDEILARAARR